VFALARVQCRELPVLASRAVVRVVLKLTAYNANDLLWEQISNKKATPSSTAGSSTRTITHGWALPGSS
jgi:hypothetical protein